MEWEASAHAVYQKHENHRNLERDTLRKLFNQYFDGAHVGDFHSIADFYEKTKPSIDMTAEELNEIFNETGTAMQIRPEMVAIIE